MSQAIQALGAEAIHGRLQGKLAKWTIKENALQRIHTCHAYLKSLELVYQIGKMAEESDHHPDLMLNYKRVTIRYWTHTAKGITELDVAEAEKVEDLIQSSFSD